MFLIPTIIMESTAICETEESAKTSAFIGFSPPLKPNLYTLVWIEKIVHNIQFIHDSRDNQSQQTKGSRKQLNLKSTLTGGRPKCAQNSKLKLLSAPVSVGSRSFKDLVEF